MLTKLFKTWAFRRSEKEIKEYLDIFSEGSADQNGKVLGYAALFHYQIAGKDPEFEMLLNSGKGLNHGPISLYVPNLNRLVNQLHDAGRFDEAAAMKLWNVTFRCMSDDSFHNHGVRLWNIASNSFDSAREYLHGQLAQWIEFGNREADEKVEEILSLCDFVPPQFQENR